MALVLEVVGLHAASMGPNVRRVLGDLELKIGRDSDNDWILPQSYVSRRQAVIRCVNGMYFLEQIGSCPIVLNETGRPLERNCIARLSAGDRIMIDDIEIRVLETRAQSAAAPGGGAPTASPNSACRRAAPAGHGFAVAARRIRRSAGAARRCAGAGPEAPGARRAADAGSRLDSRRGDGAGRGDEPGGEPRRGRCAGAIGQLVRGIARLAAGAGRAAGPPARATPAAECSTRVPPAAAPSAGGGASLENLLRGAGLDPAQAQLSEEVAGQLGEVLRIVVEGTMQVLQARNQIRKEFRMATTQVAPKNNNPLKFSADVADALHKLLVQRSPAYLDTVSSFADAFDDIRVHQLAMLEGLRVAFDFMFKQFDPEVLQAQFAKQGARGSVLGIGGKQKPWEAYAARYGELAADRDFAFRRLFGEEFGKAYEHNLERQKRMLKADKNVR